MEAYEGTRINRSIQFQIFFFQSVLIEMYH